MANTIDEKSDPCPCINCPEVRWYIPCWTGCQAERDWEARQPHEIENPEVKRIREREYAESVDNVAWARAHGSEIVTPNPCDGCKHKPGRYFGPCIHCSRNPKATKDYFEPEAKKHE